MISFNGLFCQAASNNIFLSHLYPSSPETSILHRFEEVPVNLNTGVPSVNVPIYELKDRGAMVPIYLSYHAGGNKVSDLASWVGLGWSLNAGGSIFRRVNGTPDDRNVPGTGFLEFRDMYDPSDIDSWWIAENEVEIDRITTGCYDTQPDFFNFSFMGIRGKIIFNWTAGSDPEIISKDNVILESYTLDNDGEIIEWVLKGQDGLQYTFAAVERTTVNSTTSLSAPCSTAPLSYNSAWHLTQIYNPILNSSITFNYNDYSVNHNRNYVQTRTALKLTTNPRCTAPYQGQLSISQSQTTFNGKQLASIVPSNGKLKIEFEADLSRNDLPPGTSSNNFDALQYIKVVKNDASNTIIKQYEFDYFASGNRLLSKSIQEANSDLTVKLPATEFTYFAGTIPESYNSNNIDHWGFYNGANNSTLMPTFINLGNNGQNIVIEGGDREPSLTNTKAGVLETVTYPTGGKTMFDYELNAYSFIGSQTVEDQNSFTMEEFFVGSIISGTESTAPIDTQIHTSTEFEIASSQTVDLVIKGTTYVTFNGQQFSPKVYILDENDSEVWSWLMPVAIPGQEPSIENTTQSVSLNPGTYKIRTRATAFTSQTIDNISAVLTWTEPHTLIKIKKVGGLRVASITNYDSDGTTQLTKRNFDYSFEHEGDDEYSSGVIAIEPIYVYDAINLEGDDSGFEVYCDYYQIVGTSNIITETANGSHISYRQVKEFYNDSQTANGMKVSDFFTSFDFSDIHEIDKPFSYPITKYFKRGVIESESYFEAQDLNTPIRTVDYEYIFKEESYDNRKITSGILNPPIGYSSLSMLYDLEEFTDRYAFSQKPINIGYNVLSRMTETLDNVETVTDYVYENNLSHSNPREMTISNPVNASQTKSFTTKYFYAGDYNLSTSVRLDLESLNMIIPAWKTEEWVNNDQLNGQRTRYGYIHPVNGTNVGTNPSTIEVPYPDEVEHFERTYDESGTLLPGIWEDQMEFKSHHISNRKPKAIRLNNWPHDAVLTWSGTGQLQKWDYEDYERDFTYNPDHDLLTNSVEIDETSKTYTYDDFLRLKTIQDDQRSVVTTLTYDYKSGSTPNQVTSNVFYPELGNNTGVNIKSKEIFDGLGRSIQNIGLFQGESQSDPSTPITESVVTSTEYDDIGRPFRRYEPVGVSTLENSSVTLSTANFGQAEYSYDIHTASITNNFTLTSYEDSPLGRVIGSTMPDWDTSKQIIYGSNSTGDKVLNDLTFDLDNPTCTGCWSENSLFKETQIDENGNKQILFKDILGRELLQRRESEDGSEQSNTYKTYDDKHRLSVIHPPGTAGPYVPTNHDKLIYKYSYYGNDLMKTKKLPDQDNVHEYIYDDRDLLRFYQDPNLNVQNKWILSMYDKYGREELSGFYNKSELSASDISFPQNSFFDYKMYHEFGTNHEVDKIVKKCYDSFVHRALEEYTYDQTGRLTSNYIVDLSTLVLSTYGNTGSGPVDVSNMIETHIANDAFIKIDDPSDPENYIIIPDEKSYTITNSYDDADNVVEKRIDFGGYPNDFHTIEHKDFDIANRFIGESVFINEGKRYQLNASQDWVLEQGSKYTHSLSSLEYTSKGELKRLKLGVDNNLNALETNDYTYLPNGFLNTINDINQSNHLFSLTLNYMNPGATSSTGDDFPGNGNIYQQTSRLTENTVSRSNNYTYDFLDRLTASDDQFNDNTTYSYADYRGNFASITRDIGGIKIDDLTFSYIDTDKTNRVERVEDDISGTGFDEEGIGYFERSSNDYQYDANGNMTFDPSREATIIYDHNNLPYTINTPDGQIWYNYTFDGQLVQKIVTEGSDNTQNRIYFDNVEINNHELEYLHHGNGYLKRGNYCSNNSQPLVLIGDETINKEYSAVSINSLKTITTADTIVYRGKDRVTLNEGFRSQTQQSSLPSAGVYSQNHFRIIQEPFNCAELENSLVPHYFIKDHLGNTRGEFKEVSDEAGNVTKEVLGQHTYYPFGGLIELAADQSDNKYLYNGKERQEELGLRYYNYGARFYDPSIGRFISTDPATEIYISISPYVYVSNNPIKFVDPTGAFIELFDTSGNKIGEDENGNDGNVSIISDKKEVKRIKKNTKNGQLATADDVAIGFQTTKAVIAESLDVLQRTEGNGGLSEETSLVMNDGEIIHGETGDPASIESGNSNATTTIPELPEGSTDADVAALIHSHPTKVQESKNQIFGFSALEPTAPDDYRAIGRFSTNVIVGRLGKASSVKGRTIKASLGAAFFRTGSAAPILKIKKKALQKITQ